MDTTRRQLLAAIPAVGIAATVGQGQDAPAPEIERWEYYTLNTSAWILEDQLDLPLPRLLVRYGVMGYSVASLRPGPMIGTHEQAIVIFKRPIDKSKRVVWNYQSFAENKRDLPRRYRDLGEQGWEIFYVTPLEGVPRVIHAQRPSKGVEVDNR